MSPIRLNHLYVSQTRLNNCIGHNDNVCKWLEDIQTIHTAAAYVHQEQQMNNVA